MIQLWDILISTGLAMFLISLIALFCRKLISEWLTADIRYRYESKMEELKASLKKESDLQIEQARFDYDKKMEEIKADLKKDYGFQIAGVQADFTRQNNEFHGKLLHELEILRDKELSGHKDKILIYRLAVEIFAELYVDLQKAFREKAFSPEIIDKYNYGWVRCYGYLCMLAPQEVMDSFDRMNDYILKMLSGRSPIQPWAITRQYALDFLNSVRKDIGLAKEAIEYHGEL